MDIGPLTITATGWDMTDATKWAKIPLDVGASNDRGSPQLLRLFVSMVGAVKGDVASMFLALRSSAKVYGLVPFTATAVAGTVVPAGSGAEMLATVSNNGKDFFDLVGMVASKDKLAEIQWYVGCPDALPGAVSAIHVNGALTNIT